LSPLCSRATFDTTRRYRYRLIHDWTGSPERVAFIMLNPSTADERTLDPTIRRCIGFAKAWGFGGIDVVNLFAWRTTDPAALARVADPIGPRNDGMIAAALRQSAVAVAAWGCERIARHRSAAMERMAVELGVPLFCIGVTRRGDPRHPLYVAGATAARRFEGSRTARAPREGGTRRR
jgi:hypothetical protein